MKLRSISAFLAIGEAIGVIWFLVKLHQHPPVVLRTASLLTVSCCPLVPGVFCKCKTHSNSVSQVLSLETPCSCNHFRILLCYFDHTVLCKEAETGGENLTEGFGVISAEPY